MRRWAVLVVVVSAFAALRIAPTRQSGSADERADWAIRRSVDVFFESALTRPGAAVRVVEDGQAFRAAVSALPQSLREKSDGGYLRLPGPLPKRLAVEVQRVVFRSPVRAMAALRIEYLGGPYSGDVLVEDGRWLLGASLVCSVLSQAGVGRQLPSRCAQTSGVETGPLLSGTAVSVRGDGPADLEEAVDGIQRAFHVVFAPHEYWDRRVAALEGGRELEPLVRYQTQVHGYPGSFGSEVWVSSIVFRSPTRADVAFFFIRPYSLNERGGSWGWEVLGGARFGENRWRVTRETFCLSFGGNLAEAHCPRQGPMPTTTTLPAPRLQVTEGFPAEPGHLLVRDGNGDVWVLDAKGSTRMSDVGLPAHDPYLSSGYDAARFGPRGEVYAQRTEGHDLVVERLIRPGQTEIVLRLPAHDDETETSGYVSSLSVGRHGLVLLYHEEAGEEEHWRAELRPWTDLAATGRRSEPIAIGPVNGTIDPTFENESPDGGYVAVSLNPNKPFDVRLLVTVPDLTVHECCPGLDNRRLGPFTVADHGAQVILVDHGVGVTFSGELWPPQVLIADRSGRTRVAYRPEPVPTPSTDRRSPFAGAVAYSGRYLAVAAGPERRQIVIVDVATGRHYDTGLWFPEVISLDWAG